MKVSLGAEVSHPPDHLHPPAATRGCFDFSPLLELFAIPNTAVVCLSCIALFWSFLSAPLGEFGGEGWEVCGDHFGETCR